MSLDYGQLYDTYLITGYAHFVTLDSEVYIYLKESLDEGGEFSTRYKASFYTEITDGMLIRIVGRVYSYKWRENVYFAFNDHSYIGQAT